MKKNRKEKYPFFLLLSLLVFIFVVEFSVMLLLHYTPIHHLLPGGHLEAHLWEAMIDGLILVIILYPFLYFFIFKPLIRQRDELEELSSNLEKFKKAVDGASDHIIITDKEGTILFANKAVEKITGYPLKEVLGNNPSLWGKVMEKEVYQKMWYRIKDQKKPYFGEFKNRKKDGKIYFADTRISPIINRKGDVEFFVGIERDITREKEIDIAKTEFISIASHQLRTPLANINWYTEMLIDDYGNELGEKPKEYVNVIRKVNNIMIGLVNALLQTSRLELGTIIVNIEETDMTSIAEDVLKELELDIERKKLNIERQYEKQSMIIKTDPTLVRIVFQNLLSNSIKYTSEKGKVIIKIKEEDKMLKIEVTDTGIGIPKEQQEDVFKKMFRADNIKKEDHEGTGLGLYIVKKTVRELKGKIYFRSPDPETKKGTTFYVILPFN